MLLFVFILCLFFFFFLSPSKEYFVASNNIDINDFVLKLESIFIYYSLLVRVNFNLNTDQFDLLSISDISSLFQKFSLEYVTRPSSTDKLYTTDVKLIDYNIIDNRSNKNLIKKTKPTNPTITNDYNLYILHNLLKSLTYTTTNINFFSNIRSLKKIINSNYSTTTKVDYSLFITYTDLTKQKKLEINDKRLLEFFINFKFP